MKLHEAIIEVLNDNKSGLTTKQIADKINQKKLYIRGDEEPVPSSQISARINRPSYMYLFERDVRVKLDYIYLSIEKDIL